MKKTVMFFVVIGGGGQNTTVSANTTDRYCAKEPEKQKSKGETYNMAKFCGNCGARLEDDAKICGTCGTSVEGVTTSIPGLKVTDPEKQKKVKKTFKLVAGLMVLSYCSRDRV